MNAINSIQSRLGVVCRHASGGLNPTAGVPAVYANDSILSAGCSALRGPGHGALDHISE